jgi:hypothetical protein
MEIQKQYNQSPSRREFSSTHAYVHWLADVHSAGVAPAFTFVAGRQRKCPQTAKALSLGR